MAYFWSSYLVLFTIVHSGTYVRPLVINIPESIEGKKGNTLLNLTCNYTLQDGDDIISIVIAKENATSGSEISLVSFRPGKDPVFVNGSYLMNRTIIKGISEVSPAPTITFTTLECSDGGIYYCTILNYIPPKPVTIKASTNIVIKVPAAKPYTITYVKTDVTTDSTNANHTGSKVSRVPISATTSQQINIFNNNKTVLVEGETVNLYCEGNVGKPSTNLSLSKVLLNGIRYSLAIFERFSVYDPETCSFLQNVSAFITISRQDNKALLQCTVNTLYASTDQIDVQYRVRIPNITEYRLGGTGTPITLSCSSVGNPTPEYAWFLAHSTSQWKFLSNNQNVTITYMNEESIYRCDVNNTIAGKMYFESKIITLEFTYTRPNITKVPDQKVYTEGTSKIELSCMSSYYPTGTYRWVLPNGTMLNGSTYSISYAKTSQSGFYTCILFYSANQEPVVLSATEKIIIGDPDITNFKCDQNSSQVSVIIGCVFGTIGLCLVSLGIIHLLRRSKLKQRSRKDQERQVTSMSDHGVSSNYEGIDGERTDHHYEELRQRKDHRYDNSSQIQVTRR